MDKNDSQLKNLHVSRFTLRISNRSIQSDFIQYLRGETSKISVLVLFGMIIVTLMMTALFLNYKSKGEEEANTVRYILVAHGFPTFFLTITVYLSRRNLKIVEMLGPSIIIPTIIIVCVSNTTDVLYITQDSRNI